MKVTSMTLIGTTAEGRKISQVVVKVAASGLAVLATFPELTQVQYLVSAIVTPASGIFADPSQTGVAPIGNQIGLSLTTNSAGVTLTITASGN